MKHERSANLKIKLNEEYNSGMFKNHTTRQLEQSAYMGPSKSLEELIVAGREQGIDKALRARQPLEPFYLTADQRKNDIYIKDKADKEQKDNSIREERQNQHL